jgi:hypothetical protein
LGYTSLTAEQRFDLHVMDSKRGSNSYLHRAIAKYGREAFVIETIYQSKDRDFTLEVMEPWFISEHRKAGIELYNIQDGGRGYKNNPRSKSVELYDADLVLVETLPSQSSAARRLSCNLSTVIQACRNADSGKASRLKDYWVCFAGSKPVKKDTSYLLERNNRIKPFLGKKRPDQSVRMMGNQYARKK